VLAPEKRLLFIDTVETRIIRVGVD
jgi:hypothetical protein